MLKSSRVGALAMLLLLTAACSGPTEPPQPPQPPQPSSPPAVTFAPLPGRSETGVSDLLTDLATDKDRAVLVGARFNGVVVPTFRFSDDGVTWKEGQLDEASAAATLSEGPEHVVRDQRRWYALGGGDNKMLSWESSDGREWRRAELDESVFNADTDEVGDLISVGAGLVAVGSRTRPGGKARPMAWRSTDGSTWKASAIAGRGGLVSVAARGRVVVAVGADDRTFLVARSTDGGQSWRRVGGIPRPPGDGRFNRYFSGVTATPTGFAAVGTAWTTSYVPIVYSSRDGRRWAAQDSADLAAAPSATGAGIAAADGQKLVITYEGESRHRLGAWARHDGWWQPVFTPLSGGAGPARADWVLESVVPSDEGWLVVVQRQDNGAVYGELWRSTYRYGSLSRVDLKPSGDDRPFVAPGSLAIQGRAMTASGRSQGLPVVWRGSSAGFEPPHALSKSTGDAVSGVVSSDKHLLAFGSVLSGLNNEVAVVWSAPGSGKWRRTPKRTFQTSSSEYAYSEIKSAARVGKRWYVVGERSNNSDVNRSALVFSSTDGRRWVAGKAARVMTKAHGEVSYDITDLAGSNEVSRRMNDVTGVPGAVVAVGETGKDDRSSAAVWRSATGGVWHLAALPHGAFQRSSASSVVSRGKVVVAAGVGWRAGSAKATPLSWSSTDGGRSWRMATLRRSPAVYSEVQIAATKKHFVILAHSEDDQDAPLAWISDQGTTWRGFGLTGVSPARGEAVALTGILGDGPDLVGLLHRRSREGSTTTVFRQRTE